MKSVVVCLGLIGLLAACETGIPEADVAELYFQLGSAYYDLGEYDSAVDAYSQALALDSSLFRAGYNLAHVYLETGQIEDARRMLEGLLSEEPENTVVLSTLAWAYYREGDLETSLEFYERVRLRLEGDADTLYNTGILLQELERFAESLDRFLALYELEGSAEYLPIIAELYEQIGDKDTAIVYLERSVSNDPEDIEARVRLAGLYADVREFGKSLAMYDELIELAEDPRPAALFARARILLLYIEDDIEGMRGVETAFEAGFTDGTAIQGLLDELPADTSSLVLELVVQFDISLDESEGSSASDG